MLPGFLGTTYEKLAALLKMDDFAGQFVLIEMLRVASLACCYRRNDFIGFIIVTSFNIGLQDGGFEHFAENLILSLGNE
jgi:hypothetical protein